MNILLCLFLACTLVPIVELALIIEVGRRMGTGVTIFLVVFSGIIGASLAKYQGLRVWQQFQEQLSAGRVPEHGILDGVLILFGGALLLAPGFLTDTIGFLCLLPASRNYFKSLLRKRLERWLAEGNVIILR